MTNVGEARTSGRTRTASTAPIRVVVEPGLRHHFPTPAEVHASLDLDPAGWTVERADTPRREATGPEGQTATVTDHVLLLLRRRRTDR
jgi:hypothetical protein